MVTLAESLWVRIKRRAGTGDIIVEVCFRLPKPDDCAHNILYIQIGTASHSQVLILTQDFTHPNTC